MIVGALRWSMLEIPLQTVVSIFTSRPLVPRTDSSDLSVVLKCNLLVMSRSYVADCIKNMHETFMGNLCDRISAVLASATTDWSLQRCDISMRDYYPAWYTARRTSMGRIRCMSTWCNTLQPWWSAFEHIDKHDFLFQKHLDLVCHRLASEFLVLHRTRNVLCKCGQYLDLMFLASSIDQAFTCALLCCVACLLERQDSLFFCHARAWTM